MHVGYQRAMVYSIKVEGRKVGLCERSTSSRLMGCEGRQIDAWHISPPEEASTPSHSHKPHTCISSLSIASSCPLLALQRKVVSDLGLAQLSKRGRNPFSRLFLQLLGGGDRHYSNLDRVLRHLPFKAFLQCEKRSVNSIFQREIIVVPDSQLARSRICELTSFRGKSSR